MPKKPQIYRNKDEILADLKKDKDFLKRLRFNKEVFWPALVEVSKNIDDAKMLLSGINGAMMDKFLGLMKEKKFSDLNLHTSLDPKDPDYDKYLKFMELFADMSVFEAKGNIEGMKGEIDVFILDEMRNRPLSSIKPKWIDQL